MYIYVQLVCVSIYIVYAFYSKRKLHIKNVRYIIHKMQDIKGFPIIF